MTKVCELQFQFENRVDVYYAVQDASTEELDFFNSTVKQLLPPLVQKDSQAETSREPSHIGYHHPRPR
jgi:hypothetical protein